ncbi:T9SS type A sorting domain-containing protein [Fluviicola taffensis]|uniref:Secretion system C-terminal sorting domain-containing protein n=1 Tax=Fluviicola taffensis (strain DSM 16823 / NCIMB 13979 / RW262) TaxID=755732 RepID=F2IB41_FLUTR|nr:T9SS type A sorting domain-containing protein [Fluviicola taffensis]AEA42124.1 hypothetical protein Fluta_0114 [Fluviicola taffensis DSM 16823]
MKKHIITITFLVALLCHSQNLVPNGNFEAGSYDGGSEPIEFYSGTYTGNWWSDLTSSSTHHRFDNSMQGTWYVAKADKTYNGKRRDSPDWIDPNIWYNTEHGGNCTETRYVRSAYPTESIMVKMADGHKLVKGQTYTFKIKARGGKGTEFPSHQFRLAFTADPEGLYCLNKKKWYVKEFYVENSCDWHYFEHTFTVPDNDDKKYEDMGWLVLNVNYYRDGSNEPNDYGAVFNFDDVVLTIEPKCIDTRYIQDRVYAQGEHKIEQANVEIRAGAHVSPYSWQSQFPVVLKPTSMVIYRAPTVYLEPGFFIEEDGSYFETQVGTCVEDPCPGVPNFTPPPIAQCTGSFTLGNDFLETPGVFYVWEPANYFSAPWSRVTNVTRPPNDDGCVDAKLTIWTICGAIQVHNFKLQFIDAAPTIDIANVTMSQTGISGYINLQNTSEYTIQGINTVTGAIVFEDEYEWDCQNGSQHIPFSVNHCTGNLCQNLEIKITASNPCFGSVSESLQWQAPNVPDYDLQVSNLVSNDFEFHFDWTIPTTYEYVKVQVWNEAKTEKICEWNYNRCSNPINLNNPYHFDIRNCLGDGCFSQCENYKILLETKQYCNALVSHKEISWNKSSTTFAMPVNYPNIITANNDGVNDVLCFEPTGADSYHIYVNNRWGTPEYEDEGCVDELPICVWVPSSNLDDANYFYTIQFSNQCGYADEHTAIILVIMGIPQNNQPQEAQNSGLSIVMDEIVTVPKVSKDNISLSWSVNAYPNPAEDMVFIQSSEEITRITLRDVLGKEILSKKINDMNTSISISNYASGYYILDVNSQAGVKSINLIKR